MLRGLGRDEELIFESWEVAEGDHAVDGVVVIATIQEGSNHLGFGPNLERESALDELLDPLHNVLAGRAISDDGSSP